MYSKEKFYMNFHLIDDLWMEFTVLQNEMMQEECLHHLYYVTFIAQARLTNNNLRQKLSRIEYLIPSANVIA